VAGEGSPPAFRRVTERMAAAIPDSRTVLVGGGHFIDPGEADVLKFVGGHCCIKAKEHRRG